MDEEKNTTPSEVLEKIIALTFARHAGLPDDEFSEKMGISIEKGEEQAVREAKYNLMVACTKELFRARHTINIVGATMKLYAEKGE